jgi:hypothetical protein
MSPQTETKASVGFKAGVKQIFLSLVESKTVSFLYLLLISAIDTVALGFPQTAPIVWFVSLNLSS